MSIFDVVNIVIHIAYYCFHTYAHISYSITLNCCNLLEITLGKSSIVRAVSSGLPEVNDYPFTTRGVSVGHIVDKERYLRFQVMDTPGLLDRPEEDRNEMEKLTFASLLHLPTAVIFVIDPSGLSGEKSNLDAQLNVRNYLRGRFPKRPWLDVISKADLDISDDVKKKLPEGIRNFNILQYMHVHSLIRDFIHLCII